MNKDNWIRITPMIEPNGYRWLLTDHVNDSDVRKMLMGIYPDISFAAMQDLLEESVVCNGRLGTTDLTEIYIKAEVFYGS